MSKETVERTANIAELREVGQQAKNRARAWIEESKKYPTDRAAELLAKVLEDERGLDFTVSFVDGVIRPEDMHVAARTMKTLASASLNFLPWYLRAPVKLGGVFSELLPQIVIPLVRRVFAMLVGDLVVDVSEKNLGPAIARIKNRGNGARLNMNLLGEAVLGDKEAAKRLRDTENLLRRDDVDYVSLKVTAVTGPHNAWAYDQTVDRAVAALLPLYQLAASYSPKKFINLDMEEYHDLHMTIDVFKRILETPGLEDLEAGIVLQAYLPDSLVAMNNLQAWAAERVAKGGARIKVRVVKGANLSMETVDAVMHGWPLTVEPSKADTDANYIQILDYALTKEHTKNLRIGVAGMNMFTCAFGYELARHRGLSIGQGQDVEFEMLSGMAAPQAQAVTEDVGPLLYYVPVVNPEEFDVAIAYLVRRLEENSAAQNFMSNIFDLDEETVVRHEEENFERALELVETVPVGAFRTQNRLEESDEDILAPVKDPNGNWRFQNTPDSDPALPANMEWARRIRDRIADSQLGVKRAAEAEVKSLDELDKLIADTVKAGEEWAARPVEERSEIIHRAGLELARRRADLIEVAGSEAGKAIDQGDVEVSEAVDFCHYYAESIKEIESVDGAEFHPAKLTLVTPPWNFPLAIPCGGVVAALAAGSPVIFKPSKESKRCGALITECLLVAGVPEEVLRLVQTPDREVGKALISDSRVERLVLTGSIDTARMFRSWRPDLGLMAETSGKNAIIVTPSADLDLAVADIVYGAFGHAGQKCSAASLAILVGSTGVSRRVHDQLLDAVNSLVVDYPSNLATQMGPLVRKPDEKLYRGLTTLEPGQHWAIKPKQLDDSGLLWSPGVRAGVEPNSEYHMVEYFGPILGIIRCDTLEEAVEIQNAVDYGLTAGIHSLDADEINYWLEHVNAGNTYVNRGITGAIVQRQSFGGWKRSAVGATAKTGGPNYLAYLGDWTARQPAHTDADESALTDRVLREAWQAAGSLAEGTGFVRDALVTDQAAVDGFFRASDVTGLSAERNVFRYHPLPVLVRLSEGSAESELLRVVAAGLAIGSDVSVSSAVAPSDRVADFFNAHGVNVGLQSDADFLDWVPTWEKDATAANLDARIRLIGGNHRALSEALGGSVDVAIWSSPVTYSGRVEMLPFVHEQTVAFTNHRFGNRTPLTEQVII
ncbi:MAG: bifunctional proline dehydrogenase/L-glutamate gamma-semialdehyde dehydrogenase [Varibaculum sp.]|nr:bifunctional proline dehydrogenase/L-glutamate gamma-semialdehyde dehydrogenase [Varibaculum sp.]